MDNNNGNFYSPVPGQPPMYHLQQQSQQQPQQYPTQQGFQAFQRSQQQEQQLHFPQSKIVPSQELQQTQPPQFALLGHQYTSQPPSVTGKQQHQQQQSMQQIQMQQVQQIPAVSVVPMQQPPPPMVLYTLPDGTTTMMSAAAITEHETQARAKREFEEAHALAESFRMRVLFAIQDHEPLDLKDGMKLFEIIDTSKDGHLSLDEIKAACLAGKHKGVVRQGNQEAIDFLEKYKSTPLGCLKSERMINMIFKKVDVNNDGQLNFMEWKVFLAEMVKRDMAFLVEKGWAVRDVYWAKGLPHGTIEIPGVVPTWTEWWGDYVYYEFNTHHLLGIFCADPDNMLSRPERLTIEFCTLCFILLLTSALALAGVTSDSDNGGGAALLFVYVTLPSMLLRTILDKSMACPCLVRRHNMTFLRRCCFPVLEFLGHFVGALMVLLSIIFLILGIIMGVRAGESFGYSFIQSWFMGYLSAVARDLLVPFNPFPSVKNISETTQLCCCYPLKLLGLAKWQIQRESALTKLKQKLKENESKKKQTDEEALQYGIEGQATIDILDVPAAADAAAVATSNVKCSAVMPDPNPAVHLQASSPSGDRAGGEGSAGNVGGNSVGVDNVSSTSQHGSGSGSEQSTTVDEIRAPEGSRSRKHNSVAPI